MTEDDDDLLLQALARVPLIQSDMRWETRVRERCHSAIVRRASRRMRAGRKRSGGTFIDVAAVITLGVYLAAVLAEAARLVARAGAAPF